MPYSVLVFCCQPKFSVILPLPDLKLFSDMASKAIRNYEQAVQTGLKLQEEATKIFSGFSAQPSPVTSCQERFAKLTSLASETLPTMQKTMDEALKLAAKNNQKAMDLFKLALDAAQTPGVGESQAKWIKLWSESLAASRASVESATQLGNEAFDSWMDYVRKNTEVTEVRIPKAAV